jgi:serpin B
MKRVVICLSLLGCGGAPEAGDYEVVSDLPRDTAPAGGDVGQLAADNAAFATSLYQLVAAEPGNVFFSPYSISTALAMTFAGARGQTAAQMVDAVHLQLPPDRLHVAFNALDLELASRQGTLATANSLWGLQGATWEPAFLDTLAVNYGAGLNEEDFVRDPEAARLAINGWVADHTDDRIGELLAPGTIDSETRLVLTNAIYFQASWTKSFPSSGTADRAFFIGDQEVSVPSMQQIQERYDYVERDGYRAIELPFGEQRERELTMTIIEPDDLAALDANLGQALADVDAGLATPEATHLVDLTLPKFRYRAPLGLADKLRALGMIDAFEDIADLSGLTTSERLRIADVVHEGIVGIDELGVEAAAATGVITEPVSLPPSATFTIDHPFVFVIRDRPTGAILFIGRVVDPR